MLIVLLLAAIFGGVFINIVHYYQLKPQESSSSYFLADNKKMKKKGSRNALQHKKLKPTGSILLEPTIGSAEQCEPDTTGNAAAAALARKTMAMHMEMQMLREHVEKLKRQHKADTSTRNFKKKGAIYIPADPDGRVVDRKSPGRPRIGSRNIDRIILRAAREDPRRTSTDIQMIVTSVMEPVPSRRTIRRRLQENRLHGRRPVKKPLIPAAPVLPDNIILDKVTYDPTGNEVYDIGSDVDDIELEPSSFLLSSEVDKTDTQTVSKKASVTGKKKSKSNGEKVLKKADEKEVKHETPEKKSKSNGEKVLKKADDKEVKHETPEKKSKSSGEKVLKKADDKEAKHETPEKKSDKKPNMEKTDKTQRSRSQKSSRSKKSKKSNKIIRKNESKET